jgi:hypothetical protein
VLGDDVPADRQTEPRAFAGWLGGEERLKQFVADLGRNAGAVVAYLDLDGVCEVARRDPEQRVERPVRRLAPALVGGVEAIAEQV